MVVMPLKAFDHIPFLTEKGPAAWGLLAFRRNGFHRSISSAPQKKLTRAKCLKNSGLSRPRFIFFHSSERHDRFCD